MKNHHGFSLIGVLIASSLIGFLALGVASLVRMGFTAQKGIQSVDDARTITEAMSSLLQDEDACFNTFGGRRPNAANPANITQIRDKDNTAIYRENTIYGNQTLTFLSVELGGSNTDPKSGLTRYTAKTGPLGLALAVVRWRKTGESQGPQELSRHFFVNVELSGNNITRCQSTGENEDIWQRHPTNPSRIYYIEGNVGVGTMDPPSLFTIDTTNPGPLFTVDRNLDSATNVNISNSNGGTNARAGLNLNSSAGSLEFFANSSGHTQVFGVPAGGAAVLRARGLSGLILGTNSAAPVHLVTGNTARMTVAPDGSVGIGTTSPRNFEVSIGSGGYPPNSGNIPRTMFRLSPANNNNTLDFGVNDSPRQAWLQVTRTNDLSLNGGLLLNPNGGSIGIGTTAPGLGLDIANGDIGFPQTSGSNQRGMVRMRPSGIGSSLDFGMNDSPRTGWIQVTHQNNLGSTGALLLNPNGGNVGIGVSAPTMGFELAQGVIGFPRTGGTNQRGLARFSPDGTGVTLDFGVNSSPAVAWMQATRVGDLSATHGLVLNPNGGKVGIGTTSPEYKVDINPDNDGLGLRVISGRITLEDPKDAGNTAIIVKNRSTNEAGEKSVLVLARSWGNQYPEAGATLGVISFRCAHGSSSNLCSNGSKIMSMATQNHNGSRYGSRLIFATVRNGDTTPSNTMILEENGHVGVGGGASNNHRLLVHGNIYVAGTDKNCFIGNNISGAGAINCSSDAALKKNIRPIENALEKILKIDGVRFTWNERSKINGRNSVGFIAQNVEAQFPEFVMKGPDGYKTLAHDALISPLLQAVKEIYYRFTEWLTKHDREIASLREENSELRRRLEALEHKMHQREPSR